VLKKNPARSLIAMVANNLAANVMARVATAINAGTTAVAAAVDEAVVRGVAMVASADARTNAPANVLKARISRLRKAPMVTRTANASRPAAVVIVIGITARGIETTARRIRMMR
jgi:hypothetical protein